MPKVTVRVPEDLKEDMESHSEINWSEVARKAFSREVSKKQLADSIANESDLDELEAEEIGEKIKKGMAEKHGL
ncbi:MAG: hypothetical protein ABEJ72_07440 [Candidatus Aenigmatarchaeota archaeon]